MVESTPEGLRDRYTARLTADLDALRAASDQTVASRATVELDQSSVGRLSRMDALQQQAMAAAQEARRGARIRATAAALDRLTGEDFGWCTVCGEFIGLARLDLDPTIMRCLDCAH
jgi:DnaK suppressor protein